MSLSLWHQIIECYPELTNDDFDPMYGTILLRNDADGAGDYIEKWKYSKPIPASFKLGK
jgi:hypothetical protein